MWTRSVKPIRAPFARVLLDAAEALRAVCGADFELAELWLLIETLRERGAGLESLPRGTKEAMLRGMLDVYRTILGGDPTAPAVLYSHASRLRFWIASSEFAAILEAP